MLVPVGCHLHERLGRESNDNFGGEHAADARKKRAMRGTGCRCYSRPLLTASRTGTIATRRLPIATSRDPCPRPPQPLKGSRTLPRGGHGFA